MNEITIKPIKLYFTSNVVLGFANCRLNGIVKRYMEKQMWSQREWVDFPAKHGRLVHIRKRMAGLYRFFKKKNKPISHCVFA